MRYFADSRMEHRGWSLAFAPRNEHETQRLCKRRAQRVHLFAFRARGLLLSLLAFLVEELQTAITLFLDIVQVRHPHGLVRLPCTRLHTGDRSPGRGAKSYIRVAVICSEHVETIGSLDVPSDKPPRVQGALLACELQLENVTCRDAGCP